MRTPRKRLRHCTSVALAACVLVAFTSAKAQTQADSGARSELSTIEVGQETALAEDELRKGSSLTRQGEFVNAIPLLLDAQAQLPTDFRVNFNLALCYVGINQFEPAIEILVKLRAAGHDNADVNNLLAQAYIAKADDREAFAALERAASITPTNEKLYLYVADACMGKQDYELGLRVVALGLKYLPQSAWLHYERGMFLSLLDQFDSGKSDLALAHKMAPATDVAFIAATQEAIFEGNIKGAVESARQGIQEGHRHFLLLTLLGEALLRSGVTPGQPEFEEAESLLEKSTTEHPTRQGSQLALGKLYLIANRLEEAIVHLELARRLDPSDPSVYSHLAVAYRRQGNAEKAKQVLASLAELNQKQAAKIRAAPGDRKMGYGTVTTSTPVP